MLEQNNHAEICPVCKGSGKYTKYYNMGSSSSGSVYSESTCHGCKGTGWVIVPDNKQYSITGG